MKSVRGSKSRLNHRSKSRSTLHARGGKSPPNTPPKSNPNIRRGRTVKPQPLGESKHRTRSPSRFVASPPRWPGIRPGKTGRSRSPIKLIDTGHIVDNMYGPSSSWQYSGPSGSWGVHGMPIPHGPLGAIEYKRKHTYTGDFRHGMRHGPGELQVVDAERDLHDRPGPDRLGPTYTGDWKFDKFDPYVQWNREFKHRQGQLKRDNTKTRKKQNPQNIVYIHK